MRTYYTNHLASHGLPSLGTLCSLTPKQIERMGFSMFVDKQTLYRSNECTTSFCPFCLSTAMANEQAAKHYENLRAAHAQAIEATHKLIDRAMADCDRYPPKEGDFSLLSKGKGEVRIEGMIYEYSAEDQKTLGLIPPTTEPKCDCGSASVNSPKHSTWCQLYNYKAPDYGDQHIWQAMDLKRRSWTCGRCGFEAFELRHLPGHIAPGSPPCPGRKP